MTEIRLPIPHTLQYDAWHWLDAEGLTAKVPSVRSSDYGLCLRDPFRYYLARRLGLVPPLEWSPALNRGTWFHHCLARYDLPDDELETELRGVLLDVKASLEELAREAGKDHLPLWEREEKDMRTALAWWKAAACNVQMSSEHGTLRDYLRRPCFRCLGREVLLVHKGDLTMVAQADLLLHNTETNQLWIVDGKTAAVGPKVRLATCPIEFQTLHYMETTRKMLLEGIIQEHYNLDGRVRLGGMIHAAVQKCPLEFGREDRPFVEHEHTLQRGPRTGQVETRRVYEGEPTFDNYLQRQSEWYTASGRYEHRTAEIGDDPPVNLSFTFSGGADMGGRGDIIYSSMLNVVARYARVDPAPSNFPMSADNLRPFRGKRLSLYAPFYLMPVHLWPNIIADEGFQRVDRDDGLDLSRSAVIEQEEE